MNRIKISMKIGLSLFAIAWGLVGVSSTTFAESNCVQLQEARYISLFRENFREQELTDAEMVEFSEVIRHINGLIGNGRLIIPPYIEVKIIHPSEGAIYAPDIKTMVIPYRLTTEKLHHADELVHARGLIRNTHAVMAHEYGHAVYYESIGKFAPDLEKAIAAQIDENKLRHQAADYIFSTYATELKNLKDKTGISYTSENLFDLGKLTLESYKSELYIDGQWNLPYMPQEYDYYIRLKNEGNLAEWEAYKKLRESVKDERDRIRIYVLRQTELYNGERLLDIDVPLNGYNEVFADTAAVLYFADPNINADVVSSIRNGEVKLSQADVDVRKFEGSREPLPQDANEAYSYFSAIRRHLGNKYLKDPRIMRQPERVLWALGRAIGQRLIDRVEKHDFLKDNDANRQLDKERFAERNEAFKAAIDLEFKAEFGADFPELFR